MGEALRRYAQEPMPVPTPQVGALFDALRRSHGREATEASTFSALNRLKRAEEDIFTLSNRGGEVHGNFELLKRPCMRRRKMFKSLPVEGLLSSIARGGARVGSMADYNR